MHSFRAMNTMFSLSGLPARSVGKAIDWFAFVENKLSRFLPDSELSALNRSGGRPCLASALLFQAVSAADRYYRETDGLFNPYLGRLIAGYGYAESFELVAGKQTDDCVPAAEHWHAATGSGSSIASLNPGMMSITLPVSVSVDLGGIAKGWSAAELERMLRKDGIRSGAVDAGGDIALWGVSEDGFDIGVAHPFDPTKDLLALQMRCSAGIATSSVIKRRWRDTNGRELNHILDPARMEPVNDSDFVQVTVIAPDLTAAEVYAKCLLLLGSERGIPWLAERQPNFAYIGIRKDCSVAIGPALTRYAEII